MRILLKSKIQKAIVTEANKDYIGSITIDETLMEKADLWEGEQVLVADKTNGERVTTYVLKGKKNSGIICMNGPAAHHIRVGDELVIMAFAISEKPIKVNNIVVNAKNQFVKTI